MKILKNGISIVIAFLLMFSIMFFISTNILNNKILNKSYILSKMQQTKFNLQLSREIESGFENYIYQSGLPEDTIKNLFTEDMLQKDVDSIVDALYEGSEIVLSENELRTNLENRIEEYTAAQNMNLNEQGRKNIKNFENLIVNEYTENVKVSETLYKQGNEIIAKINIISEKIGNLPLIIMIILIVILIVINIKDLLMVINFLGISFLSLGILFKIGVKLIFANIAIDNLVIFTTSLSSLVISIIKENLYEISDNGTTFIVCGITAIIVSSIFKNIDFSKNKEMKPRRRNYNLEK